MQNSDKNHSLFEIPIVAGDKEMFDLLLDFNINLNKKGCICINGLTEKFDSNIVSNSICAAALNGRFQMLDMIL
jgi:hypothetical protein